jgi:hypothetical protein
MGSQPEAQATPPHRRLFGGSVMQWQGSEWLLVIGGPLIVIVFIALVIATPHGRNSASPASAGSDWVYASRELSPELADLKDAQTAGNVQHAAQIRERIIKTCRVYQAGKPDGSDLNGAVRTICGAYGVTMP